MHSLKKRYLWPLGLLFGCHASSETPEQQRGARPAESQAIEVSRAVVNKRAMPKSLRLTGSLVSGNTADVAANASGRVAKVFVERGATVEEGAPLVQLDLHMVSFGAAEARANLEVVEAQRSLANQQCQRNRKLFDKGAISKEEWDRIDNACQSARSSVQGAQARARQALRTVDDATVRAPFAGLIGERFVSVGEYVSPPSRVVSLAQLTPLRLRIGVPEGHLSAIVLGNKVNFRVEAFGDRRFEATIKYVSPQVRPDSRDIVIEAELDNSDKTLRPGMFADADFVLPAEELLVVPDAAIRRASDGARLFAIVDGRLEEHVVSLGPQQDGFVAVLRGVAEGQSVVAKLSDAVRDGVSVR